MGEVTKVRKMGATKGCQRRSKSEKGKGKQGQPSSKDLRRGLSSEA